MSNPPARVRQAPICIRLSSTPSMTATETALPEEIASPAPSRAETIEVRP
jgi:hypothetical protein